MNRQDSTGQRISRAFARTMLEVFQSGERFMDREHIENRYILLDEAIRAGVMSCELQSIYDWTVRDRPDIDPHHYSSEEFV